MSNKKELTPEQKEALEKAKLQKLNNETDAQEKNLLKQEAFQGTLKAGYYFIAYVMQDLRKTIMLEPEREKKKRMLKELKKGVLCQELLEHYKDKVDVMLEWIKMQKEDVSKKKLIRNAIKKVREAQEADNKGQMKIEIPKGKTRTFGNQEKK